MTKRRNEPCFWMENKCPYCGRPNEIIYKPDLLNGPIDYECSTRIFTTANSNPTRRFNPCYSKWSVVIDESGAEIIKELIKEK